MGRRREIKRKSQTKSVNPGGGKGNEGQKIKGRKHRSLKEGNQESKVRRKKVGRGKEKKQKIKDQ